MNSNIYQEIKISDFPPTKIYVMLNQGIRKELIESTKLRLNLKNNYCLSKWINKKSLDNGLNTKFNGGDINRWIIGSNIDNRTNINHPKYMPLWVVLDLAKIADISIEELQNDVISYRSGSRGNIIYSPKLPIKITPEFESIMFHIFGDGAACNNSTPSYFQKNPIGYNNFISKIKNCFGDFEINTNDRFKIRFPKAITDVFAYFYDINSYHSDKIRIPSRIYKTDKLNKLACITAYIVDEGHIRDVVSISSMNQKFFIDLKRLIESCGYLCGRVKPYKSSSIFNLDLSNKTIGLFYDDYSQLIEQFPNCSLANKHDKLVYIVSRRNNKSKLVEIDTEILGILEKNKLTTRQVSEKLGLANCTTLHHLEKLYKTGFVNKESISRGFVWFRLNTL